jgi:hypothetical protein
MANILGTNAWRRWYATYKASNLIKVYPTRVAESAAARNAVSFGEQHGLEAVQLRAADTLKRG